MCVVSLRGFPFEGCTGAAVRGHLRVAEDKGRLGLGSVLNPPSLPFPLDQRAKRGAPRPGTAGGGRKKPGASRRESLFKERL